MNWWETFSKVVVPIGVLLTFTGTLFSIYYTRKNIKNTKFIDTVTSERIKWMGIFRERMSEFISVIRTTKEYDTDLIGRTQEYKDKRNKEIYEEKTKLQRDIIALQCKIQLHLNPKGTRDKKILSYVKTLTDLYVSYYSDEKPDGTLNIEGKTEFRKRMLEIYSKLVDESQLYLKDEWERVKLETQKGYFVKGDDFFE